ncbi:ATP-dependent DNA helicase [Clostridium botulinum]
MVLCAKNINENGTIDLNSILQEKFNPYQKDIRYIRYGDNTFRKNDLVMQIKNNYKALNENYEEVTITNGEIGTIKQIDYNKIYVQYKRDMILYNKEDLDQLQLAYSISIHKSQGSGVKNVILVTPVSHKWTLNKNLMYVGATRAKEKCYHIALPETINYALKQSAELQRNTFLKDLLIELNKNNLTNIK